VDNKKVKLGNATIIVSLLLIGAIFAVGLSRNWQTDQLYGWPIEETSCPTPDCDEQ